MAIQIPLSKQEVFEILAAVLEYNGFAPAVGFGVVAADGSAMDFGHIVVTCERPGGLSVRVAREDDPMAGIAAMRQRELASLDASIKQLSADASIAPT